jgi:REP element-mobilizing transposase RayT
MGPDEKKRRSVRLRGYDYAFRGFFFVTICTHNKQPSLARIIDYQAQLSEIGKVVAECWKQIPVHFPRVRLDEWIIMPNHMHGILILKYPGSVNARASNNTGASKNEGTACRRPTNLGALASYETVFEEFGRPVAASLATIVRSFKSAVSKKVREEFGTANLPVWQRSYFEHVIRDEDSLNKIRNYIWENPIQWMSITYRRGTACRALALLP